MVHFTVAVILQGWPVYLRYYGSRLPINFTRFDWHPSCRESTVIFTRWDHLNNGAFDSYGGRNITGVHRTFTVLCFTVTRKFYEI